LACTAVVAPEALGVAASAVMLELLEVSVCADRAADVAEAWVLCE
jgi:hypothetical protein